MNEKYCQSENIFLEINRSLMLLVITSQNLSGESWVSIHY
jgi:hypothetical protein